MHVHRERFRGSLHGRRLRTYVELQPVIGQLHLRIASLPQALVRCLVWQIMRDVSEPRPSWPQPVDQPEGIGGMRERRRLVSGIDWGALLASTGKVVLSSLAMLAALGWIGALGVIPEATLASRAWFLFGQIAIGGAVFVAVARMLGVEELDLAWRTIVAKFERNLVSPPENREAPIA